MARAGGYRALQKCLRDGCGVMFAPTNPRQVYHSRQCKNLAVLFSLRFCHRCDLQHRHGPCPGPPPLLVLLPMGSAPQRTISGAYTDGKLPERRVFCRRYERCLSYAESKRWAGFECTGCNVNEAVSPKGWDK